MDATNGAENSKMDATSGEDNSSNGDTKRDDCPKTAHRCGTPDDDEGIVEKPPIISPFVTTTDVLNQLNKHLADLSSPDDGPIQPRFELQKRLPDGSAIPASKDEVAAADFKTKLEQSAKFVSQLATPEDRQFWAEQQRLMGNEYFRAGDYKGAMDIYLTCLVVKENTRDFVNHTLLPVLNNLAQCTSQLSMHKKTILFCDMALAEASKIQEEMSTGDNEEEHEMEDPVEPISLCKIYFKKAKAYRLTGNYEEARKALNCSLNWMEKKEKDLSLDISKSSEVGLLAPYHQTIQKEFRHLDVAEKEARKNLQRQKRAMQKIMSSTSSKSISSLSFDRKDDATWSTSSPLYGDFPDNAQMGPRQFSKLRARKTGTAQPAMLSPSLGTSIRKKMTTREIQPSYWQYYWLMVARVAKYLLSVLGEKENDDGNQISNGEPTDKRKVNESRAIID